MLCTRWSVQCYFLGTTLVLKENARKVMWNNVVELRFAVVFRGPSTCNLFWVVSCILDMHRLLSNTALESAKKALKKKPICLLDRKVDFCMRVNFKICLMVLIWFIFKRLCVFKCAQTIILLEICVVRENILLHISINRKVSV